MLRPYSNNYCVTPSVIPILFPLSFPCKRESKIIPSQHKKT